MNADVWFPPELVIEVVASEFITSVHHSTILEFEVGLLMHLRLDHLSHRSSLGVNPYCSHVKKIHSFWDLSDLSILPVNFGNLKARPVSFFKTPKAVL